jgi:hypothetical protein
VSNGDSKFPETNEAPAEHVKMARTTITIPVSLVKFIMFMCVTAQLKYINIDHSLQLNLPPPFPFKTK